MDISCPRCHESGVFEHLIELTETIEIVFAVDDNGRLQHSIVEDAEAEAENVCEAGYRCRRCRERFSKREVEFQLARTRPQFI